MQINASTGWSQATHADETLTVHQLLIGVNLEKLSPAATLLTKANRLAPKAVVHRVDTTLVPVIRTTFDVLALLRFCIIRMRMVVFV